VLLKFAVLLPRDAANSENVMKMLRGRLLHVGEAVTELQILGCVLRLSAGSARSAGDLALPQTP